MSQTMSQGEKKVNLKLLIDIKTNKIVFAEAKKDFVDFLFNILSLPLGTIIELCSKEGKVGCLSDLCKSIVGLDSDYLQPNVTKNKVTEIIAVGGNSLNICQDLLLLKDASTEKYYRCTSSGFSSSSALGGGSVFGSSPLGGSSAFGSSAFGGSKGFSSSRDCQSYFSDRPDRTCPQCGNKMSTTATYLKSSSSVRGAVSQEGYVKGVVTYMVMDNLEVKPMSTISCISLMNKFNVPDISALLEKEVQVGLNEWLAIVKASLETQAALSAVFLKGSKNEEKNSKVKVTLVDDQ